MSAFGDLFKEVCAACHLRAEVDTSTTRLRRLIDALPVGIFQTDADNRYTYTNSRWSEITGVSPEEAVGQELGKVGTSVDTSNLAGFMARLVDPRRGEFSHRFAVHRRDEAPRIVVVTSVSVPDPGGGAAGWVGTVADVTVEAGAEEAVDGPLW